MKKIFAFAIAAVALTVGCQKAQNPVNPETPVDENELVEIKFNTNIAVVETKSSVETLNGLTVQVYGINDTKPASTRQFYNLDATAADNAADGFDLTLSTTQYYDGNNNNYSFYGYYLDEATLGADDDLGVAPYTATVTITGQEDILLATTDNAGPFNGAAARQGTNPNLAFKHALSQFKFSAINLGSEEIKLSGIKVNTANTGTMTVLPTQSLVAGTDLVDINLVMDELTLVSKSSITDPQKTDYDAVAKSSVQSTVMVFPGSSYDLYFTLTQGTDMSRTLKVTVGDTIESGYAYEFQVKLYSLEKIEITATLADWEDKQISIDTDSAEEV